MKRLTLLLGLALLIATAKPATADERTVARIFFMIAQKYESLGLYDYPYARDEAGRVTQTKPAPCVVGVFGGDSVDWEVRHPPTTAPFVIPVYQVDNPGVTQSTYAVTGQVSYDNLDKPAYLEMWSEFPDGGRSFSRTLADSGPQMRFEGTSAYRPFRLPFTAKPGQTPKRITINMVVAGTGKVGLTDVRIVEPTPPASAPAAATLEQRLLARRAAALADQSTAQSSGADADATAATGLRLPPGVRVADLPPATVDLLRQQLARQLADAVQHRQDYADKLDSGTGPGGETGDAARARWQEWIANVDAQIVGLQQQIAALAPPPRAAAPLGGTADRVLAWMNEHFLVIFLPPVAFSILGSLLMRRLVRQGRGRGAVIGVFGVMLAVGVLQVFAAGVAMGLGRPASAWGTLLGCAAVLIFVSAATLPQVRRAYADAELRKLRAMDVTG